MNAKAAKLKERIERGEYPSQHVLDVASEARPAKHKRHHDTISIRVRRPSYAILKGLAAHDGQSIVDELTDLLRAEADRYGKAWTGMLSGLLTEKDQTHERESG